MITSQQLYDYGCISVEMLIKQEYLQRTKYPNLDLIEELMEFRKEYLKDKYKENKQRLFEELGDCWVVLCTLVRLNGNVNMRISYLDTLDVEDYLLSLLKRTSYQSGTAYLSSVYSFLFYISEQYGVDPGFLIEENLKKLSNRGIMHYGI